MKKKLFLAILAAFSLAAHAESSPGSFAVRGYVVEGNALLAPDEVEATLHPYTGDAVDFATIQAAVGALEKHFADAGYGLVKIVLPEQDIEDGRVRLRVVESRIGRIFVDGNRHFSEANVLASVPGLSEGGRPNMREIDAQLRVANENAAKQTNVVVRRGVREGEVDALLRVADENPLRFAVLADNTGPRDQDNSYTTGQARVGAVIQHSNLFDRDHALSMQVITSPGHVSDVKIFGAGYRIPLYASGDALEFAYGYSNVNSGKLTTAAGSYGISGSGHLFVAKYEQFLPKVGEWLPKLTYGLDYRIYTNNVTPDGGGESLIPNAEVHPFSLTYSGNARLAGQEFWGSLAWVHNIPGGKDGTTDDFTKPGGRQAATASYQLWRYSFGMTQTLPADWQLKGAVQGQHTSNALISGEQFGAGGMDSVRGFNERAVSNDYGTRGALELYTPDLGALMNLSEVRARALLFYDAAWLRRNHALPGEIKSQNISSYGVGLRFGFAKNLSARLDFASVDHGDDVRQPGSKRLHLSLMGFF
ncbi:MAG: ShlB/FhaC/HecB family hemolysin secretion/activation protein [Flavobacteriales bacterium]|nr:MAG: ShlB/FhaC/HecB family hemolysin secretion/activation protein [Flavobacteriales bacterium]